MPFNRVDYYLNRPSSHPVRCHPDTYELYRAEIRQSDGKRNAQPILDCVLAFKVVAGLDTDGDHTIDEWRKDLTDLEAEEIFEQLKQVRVYIVYQEGQKAQGKVFDNDTIKIFYPGDLGNETITVPSSYYRWKLIEFDIKPYNLEEEL